MPREHDLECNYKKLYEGSQASLTDMASRQANALGRLGRIRSAIVNSLKKNFPDTFQKAESITGKRMIDGDDEIIVAYLESFLQKKDDVGKIDLSYLKDALSTLGIQLTGNNPVAWGEQIHELRKKGMMLSNKNYNSNSVNEFNNLSNSNWVNTNKSESNELLNIDQKNNAKNKNEKIKVENNKISDIFTDEPPMTVDTLFSDFELWDTKIDDTMNERWSPSPLRSKATEIINTPQQSMVVKPELIDTKSKPKLKKAKIKAERPSDALTDIPGKILSDIEINDKVRNEIYAFVSVSRPVYIRDLVSIVGDRETIEKWENDERSNIKDSNVRFIGAKMRHRMRGSLVIPNENLRVSPKNSKQSYWWDAINFYRGSKLYELGVLLHRVGDEVVAYNYEEDSAYLILSSNNGLIGIVVAFSTIDTNNKDSYFGALLTKVSKERLNLICLLTSTADRDALENLINYTIEYTNQNSLEYSAPVIASFTWDFADDRGTTAKLVLE